MYGKILQEDTVFLEILPFGCVSYLEEKAGRGGGSWDAVWRASASEGAHQAHGAGLGHSFTSSLSVAVLPADGAVSQPTAVHASSGARPNPR